MIPTNLGRTYHRPARALIGWIDPARAAQLLAANNQRPDLAANTVRDAHMAASLRKLSVLPDGSTTGPSSPELARYLDEFRSRPEAQPYLAEGWEPQLVDLREARAFQPVVFTDRLPELCTSEDLVGLARVTLPPRSNTAPPLSFDEASTTLSISGSNPNLRIVGNFVGPVNGTNGPTGIGFVFDLQPSYVQVAMFQGHAILRDGYHRAFALLRAGIPIVPALVRQFASSQGILSPSSLPLEVVLGPSGPNLLDYHNPLVAADVNLPAQRRTLVVQGLELNLVA